MFKTIYPIKDSTIYERYPFKNTGTDQILELTKIVEGQPVRNNDTDEYWESTYNTRILLKFDISDISSSISQGKISPNIECYLTLKTTEAVELPTEYSVHAYPVSGSWVNGTGYFNNEPDITNGVSWAYRNSKLSNITWKTGSYSSNATGSWASYPGGANWYTSSIASQSFSLQSPDIRMDVTPIVRLWISGSITNEGFIVKFPDSYEQDASILGSLKFFSRETHTIFVPRLEIYWNSIDYSGTSSFNQIDSDDSVAYIKNLRESYYENEIPIIRIGNRPRYPHQTYTTSSNYLINQRMPTSSYYQIMDYQTDDIIIPFHNPGTIVNCDSRGNYIKIDCNSLLPERYYKLMFRTEFDGGETINYIDSNYVFKIARN